MTQAVKRGPPPTPFSNPGACRWCNTPVSGRRRTWCGDDCVRAYMDQFPGSMRAAVEKRDNEVCAQCGRDCRVLMERIRKRTDPFYGSSDRGAKVRALKWHRLLGRLGVSRGFRVRHLWEADHIRPLVEGGGNELANMRTLCRPCHKAETRALAGRRAAVRASAPKPEEPR